MTSQSVTLSLTENMKDHLEARGAVTTHLAQVVWQTRDGAREQFQFKVEIAKLEGGQQERYGLLLHCLEGRDVIVWWKYKVGFKSSAVDKVDFVQPGMIGVNGDSLAGGALHREVYVGRINVHNCLEVHVKVEERTKSVSVQGDIVKDLKNLFDSGDTADVQFVCGGATFPCHRAVLAARSSVFKAMFFGQGDYKERETGRVTIDGFEAEEVKQFLRFVYSGECKFDKVDPWRILKLADMYDVQMLNKICCQVPAIRLFSIKGFHCMRGCVIPLF